MSAQRAILVADDCVEDIFILRRALAASGIDAHLITARDGQQAVDYLSGESPFTDRKSHPFPCLLLLDLKMPKLNGFDVLQWIRKQPGLKRLPITVLTSSDEPKDVNRAYDLGANSYLVKPSTLGDYTGLIEKVHQYWMQANHQPDCQPPKAA